MMRCLARVPVLDPRRRSPLCRPKDRDQDLLNETRIEYQKMIAILRELRERVKTVEDLTAEQISPTDGDALLRAYYIYQRSYGLGLAVAIILNRLLNDYDNENGELDSESTQFSKEIVVIAQHSHRYRPLGSCYLVLCLASAWIGTSDEATKSLAWTQLIDYRHDFEWMRVQSSERDLKQELLRQQLGQRDS